MALHLPAWEGLGEDVRNHVICGTVNESKCTRIYCLPNEMITDVDMFGACMEIVIGGKCECRLVVAVECGWGVDVAKQLADEPTQPNAFFCSMRGCNVLSFGSGQCNKLLLARTPRNGTSVNEVRETGYGLSMVLRCPICICITYEFVFLSPVRQHIRPCRSKC